MDQPEFIAPSDVKAAVAQRARAGAEFPFAVSDVTVEFASAGRSSPEVSCGFGKH